MERNKRRNIFETEVSFINICETTPLKSSLEIDTELCEELAAITEYDGNMARDKAVEFALTKMMQDEIDFK